MFKVPGKSNKKEKRLSMDNDSTKYTKLNFQAIGRVQSRVKNSNAIA